MDIAEIRRKAKELKAREEALTADAGTGAGKDANDDDEVFELPRLAESGEESGADSDKVIVDGLVEDPPPFNMEGSSEGKSQEELPQVEEAAEIFTDDTEDTSVEDLVDSIMLPDESSPDESSKTEPLEEEASEVISLGEEELKDEVDVGSNIDDEDTICLEAITFMLGDEEYGVDMAGIKEVIKPRELTDVPRAPDNIMGLLSLRGVVIPVMDLRRRLAMGHDKEGERIIIVKDGDEYLGLVVDRIVGSVSLTRKGIEPPPSFSSIDGELISAICRCEDGESFILLNIDRIVEKS